MNKKTKNAIISAAALLIVIIISLVMSSFSSDDSGDEPSPTTAVTEATEKRTDEPASQEQTSDAPVTTTEKPTKTPETTTAPPATVPEINDDYVEYHFRNKNLLNQHFEKHGGEFTADFGYTTAAEYEKGASDVINNPEALYKTEAEDGDGVYYLEATNEFVILSTDGYIRTYFRPSGGIDYFNRQ